MLRQEHTLSAAGCCLKAPHRPQKRLEGKVRVFTGSSGFLLPLYILKVSAVLSSLLVLRSC